MKKTRILHTPPSDLPVFFVSEKFGVERRLLEHFECLWLSDGVTFQGFANAYADFHGFYRKHWLTDFEHAFVAWSALKMVEEALLVKMKTWPSQGADLETYGVDCSIGNHGQEIESFL